MGDALQLGSWLACREARAAASVCRLGDAGSRSMANEVQQHVPTDEPWRWAWSAVVDVSLELRVQEHRQHIRSSMLIHCVHRNPSFASATPLRTISANSRFPPLLVPESSTPMSSSALSPSSRTPPSSRSPTGSSTGRRYVARRCPPR